MVTDGRFTQPVAAVRWWLRIGFVLIFCGCLLIYIVQKVANSGYLCNFAVNITSMRPVKVIHVHLIGKRRDLYFGSIAAIFAVLTPEEVGCGYDYLRRAGLSGGGTVMTKKACIKQSTLITCPRGDSCRE